MFEESKVIAKHVNTRRQIFWHAKKKKKQGPRGVEFINVAPSN